jgi:Fe-S cluster biosynthesis and repair protein YggX
MTRLVQCVVLEREAQGLEAPPHPGDLGQRIYHSVSQEGWQKWLEHLTMLINENGLNTADPRTLDLIEQHMLGFFFKEGDFTGGQGFHPPRAKK